MKRTRPLPATWLLAAIALVAAPWAAADVYKWVDKNGVAHYADHPPPPPQMDVTTLKDPSASTGAAPGAVAPTGNTAVAPSAPATAAAAPGTPAPAAPAVPSGKASAAPVPAVPAKPQTYSDKELDFRKRRIEANDAREKQAKADAASARKAETCKQQRARVATLREGGRLVRFDDKGERIDLNDADREAELHTAEQQMEAACK